MYVRTYLSKSNKTRDKMTQPKISLVVNIFSQHLLEIIEVLPISGRPSNIPIYGCNHRRWGCHFTSIFCFFCFCFFCLKLIVGLHITIGPSSRQLKIIISSEESWHFGVKACVFNPTKSLQSSSLRCNKFSCLFNLCQYCNFYSMSFSTGIHHTSQMIEATGRPNSI